MRAIRLFCCCALALTTTLGGAVAGESWVEIGELHLPDKRLIGKLSINLEGMRQRNRQYEIWERVTFAAGPSGQSAAPAELAERLTLWAIRCRRGAMAKVTERVAGSFAPRSEALRFYVPSPESSGFAVIEMACAEARRRLGENRTLPEQKTLEAASDTRASLDRPPSIPDADLADDDD